MNNPPFEINAQILNSVTQITEKVTKMEYLIKNKKDLHLRKASKIKSVNSSCAIEANTLTEKEVESVINGKRVIAPPNEIIEVKNAYKAYEIIDKYKPFEIKSFLEAHKIMSENLIEESGKFRSGDVGVYSNGVAIHYGARPEFVYGLVDDLFNWGKTTEFHPLIVACVVHYEIEIIHPFRDGNGRMGRLWQSAILYNYNTLFELIPIETLIYENQQKYYEMIQKSSQNNSSTPFIEFMLDMVSQTLDVFSPNENLLTKVKEEYLDLLTNNQQSFLNMLLNKYNVNSDITMENLARKYNKAKTTIRQQLQKLTDKNILIAEGENKGRKYKFNTDIFVK